MGIFNFGKKGKVLSPSEFYTACIKEFHTEAQRHGLAKKGLIFIPELIPIGHKTTLAYLNDFEIQTTYGSDPVQYYFAVMAFALEAGMLFAEKWHSDFAGLNDYVEEIADFGPASDASELFGQYFKAELSNDDGHAFLERIYEAWMLMHAPYWDMADPRQYTFKALIAAYQLGISMMLEKLGY